MRTFRFAVITTFLLTALVGAPAASAEPNFCRTVAYGSIWESYLASPPPPEGLSDSYVKKRATEYQRKAIGIMRQEGYGKLARHYSRAMGLSNVSFRKSLRAVAQSSRFIERVCGFDPYDYSGWAAANPLPPKARSMR